jgi:hypothetical protein
MCMCDVLNVPEPGDVQLCVNGAYLLADGVDCGVGASSQTVRSRPSFTARLSTVSVVLLVYSPGRSGINLAMAPEPTPRTLAARQQSRVASMGSRTFSKGALSTPSYRFSSWRLKTVSQALNAFPLAADPAR